MNFIKTIFIVTILITAEAQVVIQASPSAKSTTLTYVSGTDFVSLIPSAQPFSASKLPTQSTESESAAASSPQTSSNLIKPPVVQNLGSSSQGESSASTTNTGSSQTNNLSSPKIVGSLPPLSPTNTPQPDQITPNPITQSNQIQAQSLTTNPPTSTVTSTGYYNYITANTAFASLSQLKKTCNSQNHIKFIAFKQYSTQYYLTSNSYFLSLMQSNSPTSQQLFTAIQNIDCSWSFQSSDGLYLSLNTGFSYLTLSSILSTGQRFYIQRKQDWIYIESASSYRYFWTISNGIVLINMNQASKFIMEMWPDLPVGWN